jgi:hypothetical protein
MTAPGDWRPPGVWPATVSVAGAHSRFGGLQSSAGAVNIVFMSSGELSTAPVAKDGLAVLQRSRLSREAARSEQQHKLSLFVKKIFLSSPSPFPNAEAWFPVPWVESVWKRNHPCRLPDTSPCHLAWRFRSRQSAGGAALAT